MLVGPDDLLYRVFIKIGDLMQKLDAPPNFEAPLTQRKINPFAEADIVQPLKASTPSTAEAPPDAMITNVKSTSSSSSSVIKDVRASDYITPQKYLDGAEVPSYYSFQSNMIPSEDLLHGMHTDLEVDRRLTLPTRTHIRFLVTATDVLHSFAIPSLNVKADALPGRVTRMNTFILREGVFYGQCSEMCGSLHSFMPIVVEAVSPEAYAAHAKKFYRE